MCKLRGVAGKDGFLLGVPAAPKRGLKRRSYKRWPLTKKNRPLRSALNFDVVAANGEQCGRVHGERPGPATMSRQSAGGLQGW